MELGLSLGSDPPSKAFVGLSSSSKARDIISTNNNNNKIGFCMALGLNSNEKQEDEETRKRNGVQTDSDPPVQLDLLPLVPVPRSASSNQQRWSSGNYTKYLFYIHTAYIYICTKQVISKQILILCI